LEVLVTLMMEEGQGSQRAVMPVVVVVVVMVHRGSTI
jgi:hypothetical protein